MKQERNSSVELLRILAIFGIVIMHTNDAVMKDCNGINQIWTQIENGVFNAGVSIFVLISGFYGINCTVKKIVSLETTVVFYSVISVVIGYVLMVNLQKTCSRALFPFQQISIGSFLVT